MSTSPFKRDLQTLRETPKRLASLPAWLKGETRTIQKNDRWSEGYKQQRIQLANETARQEIETLQGQAQAAEQNLRRKIDTVLAGDKPVGEAAVARELAVGRAWQRAARLLDSGQADAIQLIREAADSKDLTMLQAFREELPAYLRAKGQKSISDIALSLIDDLETPLLPPAQQEAKAVRLELERGLPQLGTTAQLVSRSIATGESLTVVPAWEWREVIGVEGEAR